MSEQVVPFQLIEPLPWFALRVRSNFEKKSAESLRHQGFEQFLPTYRRRSHRLDRVIWVEQPLFSGYVFCRFDPNNWLPVLQTPGVVQAVSFGGRPAPVEQGEIESIMRLVHSGLPLFPQLFLHVGQKVLIRRGPLAGVEGILEQVGKNYRIGVSINLLQRSVYTDIDADWVVGVA
jgi:transcription antitermination factor NusG